MRTLLTSGVITVLALIVCYPIAYYLAKVSTAKWLHILMLCLLVPFWVNEVLRAYAWRTLMARQEVNGAQFAGHANSPAQMLSVLFPTILHEGREAPTYVGLATLVFALSGLSLFRRSWRVAFWP